MLASQEEPIVNASTTDAPMSPRTSANTSGLSVIFGGAGFVGSNLTDALCRRGTRVRVVDNLTRPGVERNLNWLRSRYPLEVVRGDVRDFELVQDALKGASAVYHLAAQVAVTSSLLDPLFDHEVNTRGTLNVLEALRRTNSTVPLLFTSTNKVYGALGSIALEHRGMRYEPRDTLVRRWGISEQQRLEFWSPYGCSKGAADQYVLDYARHFGLRAAVFRMSCVYGPRQFGTEDQGWVAHFLLSALSGKPLTIYGDGLQVRDVLFIDDLIDALVRGAENIDALSGRAFNIGGGPENSVSLRELVKLISEVAGVHVQTRYADWRPGDQRYYASDCSSLDTAIGWKPSMGVRDGLRHLQLWLSELAADLPSPKPKHMSGVVHG